VVVVARVAEQDDRRLGRDLEVVPLVEDLERVPVVGVAVDPDDVGVGVDPLDGLRDVVGLLEEARDLVDAVDEHP
jgi:hypothetical protein